MSSSQISMAKQELQVIRRRVRGMLFSVALFSVFINLLMLTGPMFMLQVYDRVLGSKSVETLVALFILMAFLFLMMGILDAARGKILARYGAKIQAELDHRVFDAALKKAADSQGARGDNNELRDLDAVQRFLSSSVFGAVFDLPWTPIFLLCIAFFHPWLGLLALAGGIVLVIITVLNQLMSKNAATKAAAQSYVSDRMAERLGTEAEMVRSLGMQKNSFERWKAARVQARTASLQANDVGGTFATTSKTFRMFLQSAILGLGAYLAIQGQVTPGVMIAGSILFGRALAPIDLVIGQWPLIQRARLGYSRLIDLLAEVPPPLPRTELPRPQADLLVHQLTVVPPGGVAATLRLVSFGVRPGQAVGVIGPSGSGKSTLARALVGSWPIAGGKIRLDGASLDQYDPDSLAEYIGYLPQRVQLFDGTIADNIARLSPEPNAAMVIKAAKKAAAHEMILRLPDGYDTPVSVAGGQLSGGQLQRIGLARAIYNNPMLLILDEPNSNLDHEGSMALNECVRQMKEEGRSVLIMAHRPAAIRECDLLLMLENGMVKAWGPRDAVLERVTQNTKQLDTTAAKTIGLT